MRLLFPSSPSSSENFPAESQLKGSCRAGKGWCLPQYWGAAAFKINLKFSLWWGKGLKYSIDLQWRFQAWSKELVRSFTEIFFQWDSHRAFIQIFDSLYSLAVNKGIFAQVEFLPLLKSTAKHPQTSVKLENLDVLWLLPISLFEMHFFFNKLGLQALYCFSVSKAKIFFPVSKEDTTVLICHVTFIHFWNNYICQ